MTGSSLTSAVQELGLDNKVDIALQRSIASEISIEPFGGSAQELTQLARLGFMFEVRGLAAARNPKNDSEQLDDNVRAAFKSALACWGAISANSNFSGLSDQALVSFDGLMSLDRSVALRLAVAGIASENTAETRLRLRRFELSPQIDGDWLQRVASNTAIAFVCLVRKGDGWSDISKALAAIDALRAAQKEHEQAFLDKEPDGDAQTKAALALVGFYHLAQMVTSVGLYLQSGTDGRTDVTLRLDTNHRKAVEAFDLCLTPANRHLADLVWLGCRELVRNSLWSHLQGTSEALRQFGDSLVSQKSERPVLELWPSQQQALRRNLLDPYQRAILVQMPTSAGKTLLAKFTIAQTKALNPQGKIAYIVPTRALVNQLTVDLRKDFAPLNYSVELAVPAFELDPTESQLLSDEIDILVTTPEKLDLLIRADHPSVKDLSLVVADEAHNLQEEGRGARLELLLGTIKRERLNCRFLLLSPFLPNGKELVTWLGDDRHLPPIHVDWRPSRRLVAASLANGRGANRRLALEALPAADNTDIAPGTIIPIAPREEVPTSASLAKFTNQTARALQKRGGVLILCRGKGTAAKRAKELAAGLPLKDQLSPQAAAVCEYLTAEVGFETGLANCIRRGVAFHHAGMSPEARWLVERLISRGDIDIVCGTTTLAQGVNFPISSVIVETLKKGDADLSYSDFWNIAGRAGRALVDTVGVIAFPSENKKRKEQYVKFLEGEARQISSQLAALLVAADEIGETFNLAALRQHPQLSALLQFLAHAVRVADGVDIADQLEILLRSSLVYHQARRQNERMLAKFVDLCRAYIRQVSATGRGLLSLADTTGFATPSVFHLLAQVGEEHGMKDPAEWLPSTLFGQDTSALRKRIALIAGVPEMRLGDGQGGPLDTARTAAIIRDWVNGDSIVELTHKHSRDNQDSESDEHEGDDEDKKVAAFSQYLFSTLVTNASWGIGALEGLCLAGQDKASDSGAAHVPSMIYFGVQSKEAVWLRMVGLPRIVAEGAAELWRERKLSQPASYKELRGWISGFSQKDWASALQKNPAISPENMKLIWNELSGAT